MDNVVAQFMIAMSLSSDNSDIDTAELGLATDRLSLSRGIAFAMGEEASQVNVFYHDIAIVPTGGGGITLALGPDTALTDAYGIDLDIDILKALYIKNTDTVSVVTIGAGASPLPIFGTPATHTLILRPGGEFLWTAPNVDGLAITNTTDDLKIIHGEAGNINVEVIVAGIRST